MADCCSTKKDPEETFDLLIIGGGSAAFAAAVETSTLGGTAVIFNEGLPVGGTCVNVGCVPSKAMIRAAERVHHANSHRFEGVASSARVSDFSAVTRQTTALVEELRDQKYLNVIAGDKNVRLVEARARMIEPGLVEVGGVRYRGRNVLIATGARPAFPAIPGLDAIPVLTNEDLYQLEDLPGHLIVIGGRYIALENAQMMARLGSRVTVLQRSDRILPTEAPAVTDALTEFLRGEGMNVLTRTAIQSVAPSADGVSVRVTVDGDSTEIRGTHLFIATGRHGNTDDLGLEPLGIATDGSGYLKTGPDLRTSIPTVFGAGDVLGENQFVYTAAYEGKLAAQNAFRGGTARADYSVLPWVVFTDPQVAGVGLDERQAEEVGLVVDVSTIGLEHVPRAIAARDTRGFITLIRNRATDVLVGARILAPEGSELLMEIALAIRHRVTVDSLKSEFHPYLTMSEGIKLAAISFDKSVGKLSCCAA